MPATKPHEPTVISASVNGAPASPARAGIACLALAAVAALWAGFGVPRYHGGWMAGALVELAMLGAVALLFGGMGVALLWVAWRCRAMLRREEARRRLGLDDRAFAGLLRERDIRPRYVINGEPLFDARDLGEPALLLRSAGNAGDTGADRLPRAITTGAEECRDAA